MSFRTVICCLLISAARTVLAAELPASPFRSAYIHIDQCFDAQDDIPEREAAIRRTVEECQRAGLTSIVPYVNTTSGAACYPSAILTEHRWDMWDPVAVFVRAAREHRLKVHLCVSVLVCGHNDPAGILLKQPEWALRGEDGGLIGSISPGHPDARDWIVRWLKEVVERYEPDGLLLDYLRFPSPVSQLEHESATRFAEWSADRGVDEPQDVIQEFRELLLTELMEMISEELREIRPDLHIAIYSWGFHVTSNHRVAQNWPLWAKSGWIDEVNVSGYWYPESFPNRWGKTHLEAFRTSITEAQRLLQEADSDARLTFALGVKTSHGQVKTVVDIASYLNLATELGADGVTMFTWSYLAAFLPALQEFRVLERYAAGEIIEDLTTANIRRGAQKAAVSVESSGASVAATAGSAATILVATASSSEQAKACAEFVGDGQNDEEEINRAIAALPAVGGTVLLAEGTYDIRRVDGTLGGVLIDRSNVVLAGRGPSTRLILAPDQNTNVIRIIGSGVHHVTIRDLYVDANREQNSAGQGDSSISHDRFEFCGIKGYCRDPRGPGAEDLRDIAIRNCHVLNAHRLGIMLEGSNLQVIDNVLGNAGSDSVELLTGPGMIRGNYVEITGQTHVAIGSDRGHSIQMSDNVIHVRKSGNLDIAFRTWANSQRHVISGNVLIVDDGGHCGLAMDLRGQMQAVTGNVIESLNPEKTTAIRIGGGNTTFIGNILRNVVITTDDTYDDQAPIILRDNILDRSTVEHVKGNLVR